MNEFPHLLPIFNTFLELFKESVFLLKSENNSLKLGKLLPSTFKSKSPGSLVRSQETWCRGKSPVETGDSLHSVLECSTGALEKRKKAC